jgi:hypothetical protein
MALTIRSRKPVVANTLVDSINVLANSVAAALVAAAINQGTISTLPALATSTSPVTTNSLARVVVAITRATASTCGLLSLSPFAYQDN